MVWSLTTKRTGTGGESAESAHVPFGTNKLKSPVFKYLKLLPVIEIVSWVGLTMLGLVTVTDTTTGGVAA